MASTGFGQHLPGLRIQSAIERKSPVPVVLKTMALGSARTQRQDRIQTVQGLNRALFIHAEDGGMHRRFQIQPDDVGGFLFELRIITGQVAARAVRLQPKLAPHPANGRLADPHGLRQPVTTPVGRTVGRSASSQFQNARFGLRRQPAVRRAPIARIEPGQTLLLKALFPNTDVPSGASQPLINFAVRLAFG